MTKLNGIDMIENLKKAYQQYMNAIAILEDTNIDDETKKAALSIIHEGQIHSEIALEQITS